MRHSTHEPLASLSASLNALTASLYLPSGRRPWASSSLSAFAGRGLGGSASRAEERTESTPRARLASARLRRRFIGLIDSTLSYPGQGMEGLRRRRGTVKGGEEPWANNSRSSSQI